MVAEMEEEIRATGSNSIRAYRDTTRRFTKRALMYEGACRAGTSCWQTSCSRTGVRGWRMGADISRVAGARLRGHTGKEVVLLRKPEVVLLRKPEVVLVHATLSLPPRR